MECPLLGARRRTSWSQMNRAAAQSKIMGPGARQDTLEDIFASHNYCFIWGFGRLAKL